MSEAQLRVDALFRVDLDIRGDFGMSAECDCGAELGTEGVYAPNLLDLVKAALAHRAHCTRPDITAV